MVLHPGLKQLGAYVREIVVFAAGFWCFMTVRGHWEVRQSTPASVFWDYVVFSAVAIALGALPWPRARKLSQVAVGSLVANWVFFAWVAWAVTAVVSPYPVEIWPAFPQMFVDWAIVSFALTGAVIAVAAFAVSRRLMSQRATRAATNPG